MGERSAFDDDAELLLDLEDDASFQDINELAQRAGSANGRGPPRCLLVEDDPALLHMFSSRLARAGWNVVVAGDGITAKQLAAAERPDLIVSDVHMPRANGWDVLSAVKADPALRFVPVVLITADDVFVNAAANEDLGAARVVAKSALRGDDLATLARAVAGPALALADALESHAPLRGELGSLVPAQVLGALARARLTGRVVVETAAGRRYELHIADAALIAAWVYTNGEFATHIAAVLAKLLREREGKFSVVREHVDGSGPLLVDLISRLDEDDPSVETQPPTEDPVRTDQRRYDLYARTANPNDVLLAFRVVQAPTLRAAIEQSDDPVETDRVIRDLLRKGVLRFTVSQPR